MFLHFPSQTCGIFFTRYIILVHSLYIELNTRWYLRYRCLKWKFRVSSNRSFLYCTVRFKTKTKIETIAEVLVLAEIFTIYFGWNYEKCILCHLRNFYHNTSVLFSSLNHWNSFSYYLLPERLLVLVRYEGLHGRVLTPAQQQPAPGPHPARRRRIPHILHRAN